MARISHYDVVNSLMAAENAWGESDTARDLARRLLTEILEQEIAFARAAERKATEAENELELLVPTDSAA